MDRDTEIARDKAVENLSRRMLHAASQLRMALKTLDRDALAARYVQTALGKLGSESPRDPVSIHGAINGADALLGFIRKLDSGQSYAYPTEEQFLAFQDLIRYVRETTKGTNE